MSTLKRSSHSRARRTSPHILTVDATSARMVVLRLDCEKPAVLLAAPELAVNSSDYCANWRELLASGGVPEKPSRSISRRALELLVWLACTKPQAGEIAVPVRELADLDGWRSFRAYNEKQLVVRSRQLFGQAEVSLIRSEKRGGIAYYVVSKGVTIGLQPPGSDPRAWLEQHDPEKRGIRLPSFPTGSAFNNPQYWGYVLQNEEQHRLLCGAFYHDGKGVIREGQVDKIFMEGGKPMKAGDEVLRLRRSTWHGHALPLPEQQRTIILFWATATDQPGTVPATYYGTFQLQPSTVKDLHEGSGQDFKGNQTRIHVWPVGAHKSLQDAHCAVINEAMKARRLVAPWQTPNYRSKCENLCEHCCEEKDNDSVLAERHWPNSSDGSR